VARRLAAPQVIVVHRGEVVVDERVGVDHLDGGGERQYLLGRAADRLGGRQRQHGPDPLTPGE
jgi:hypothetical protein